MFLLNYMPQINQKGAAHLLVPLILLLGIAAGVYFIQKEGFFKLFSKAGPGVNIEFVDSQGLPTKTTTIPKVTFRINYPSETYFPEKNTSAPITLEPAAVVLSEDPGQKVNTRKYTFTGQYSVIERYTFSSSTPGIKTLYAQFIMKNGKRVNANPYPATIDLVSAAPGPSATPAPTQTSSSKRVFVTSKMYNGNLGGLSGADAKCQERANAANLGGSWKAWLSDANTSASSRLTQSNVPYKRIDGVTIADNWTDLTDGALQNPIRTDETGVYPVKSSFAPYYEFEVWTNTNAYGQTFGGQFNCNNFTSISGSAQAVGMMRATDNWTFLNGYTANCDVTRRLYCFEQ